MTPRLQQLKQQLDSVKSRIKISNDTIMRMRWEIEELEKDKSSLELEIEQEKSRRINPCLERVL